MKEQGIQFAYHPHGFEFVHTPKETLFDVLMEETDPEYVTFELDTFWFVHEVRILWRTLKNIRTGLI